ncbi:MAG: hypothetical protein MZW92_12595 [Comamonadaceae bacterium]|nr:hypothetical protein [Comamonadaceae bacterium]
MNVWHNATIRGDMASVTIGEDTNVQDNAVIHVNGGVPTRIGKRVTIGHGAIIHAAVVARRRPRSAWAASSSTAPSSSEGAMVGAGNRSSRPGRPSPRTPSSIGNPMRIVREPHGSGADRQREEHRPLPCDGGRLGEGESR